ncbi:MAG: choice-of-anchor D domain-containing protein [Archangiaceae bacterium]|nr:choice-of-anchor D domain-containing protein [Archangiaceae bacterium]
MMRWLAALVVVLAGCNNFDALVERCVAEGRCGAAAMQQDGGPNNVLAPVLTATPGQLSFSLVGGEMAPSKRVTLSNLDGGVANSVTVNLGGTNAGDFALSTACGSTLSPGQSCPIDLTFRPVDQSVSTRSGVLEVRAAGAPVVQVPLSATITPSLEVPTLVEFGDVRVGTMKSTSLVVRNLSTRPANLVPTVLSPYSVESNGCASVAGMQACMIQLSVAISQPGTRDDTIQIAVGGTSLTFTVPVRVRGVTGGVVQLEPQDLFPTSEESELVGQARDRTFSLRNTGTQTIGPISLSLSADGGFSLLDAGCDLLDAGASCFGVVRFAPTSFATFGFTLSADAGPAGGDSLSDQGYARQSFTVTLQVSPPNAGPLITVGSNQCANTCTNQVLADVRTPPTLVATTKRTVAFDLGNWVGDCMGSATTACSFVMNQDRAVTLNTDIVPVMFESVTTVLGNFGVDGGALLTADAICNADALDGGLPGTYRAFFATADAGIFSRFRVGDGYASASADRFPVATLLAPLSAQLLTSRGQISTSTGFWTGIEIDGGTSSLNCQNWTNSVGGGNPPYGRLGQNSAGAWWSVAGNESCGYSHPLLCLGTGTGRPATANDRVSVDGGAVMFVMQRPPADAGLPDGGWSSPTRSELDGACRMAASSLGRTQAFAYVGLMTPAVSLGSFDAGAGTPLVRLDGKPLAPSADTLRTNWVPLVPIAFALSLDGGVSFARRGVLAGNDWGSGRSQVSDSFTVNCGGSLYLGDPSSTADWWGPASSTSSTGVTCNDLWFYCVTPP